MAPGVDEERLVYDVKATDPRVLSGLDTFEVSGRNPALPDVYRYTSGIHPQLRNLSRTEKTGNIYVVLIDSSPAGSAKAKLLASTIELPSGMIRPPSGTNNLGGVVPVKEGDVVFARDISMGGDPEQDMLEILVTTSDNDAEMAQKRAALTACRDTLLGDRTTRDNRRVWFEEQNRASEVAHGNRCYGLSNMLERPMNASGPPAAMKVVDGKLDAVQLAVKEAVRANADAGMTMWTRMAPPSLQVILESYAELVNSPRIGSYNNYMWSSTQLNLSEPQRVGEEQSLGATNGRFGDCHSDDGDSPTHLSCGTVLSDLPEEGGWEPGRMHFLGLGFYTELTPFKQFFFSGLQRHGSTRALTIDSNPIPRWACRAMMISYPPKAMALGKVSHCFSMMPGAKNPFYLTAHTTGAPHKKPANGYFTSHTTAAQDGTSSMDDAGLMNFLARGLLQWSYDVMEQVPPRLRVTIDKSLFLGAFKFHDETGEEVSLYPWPHGPAPEAHNRFEQRHVDIEVALLHDLYNRASAAIPGISPNTLEREYLTNRGSRTRPATYKLPTKRLSPLEPYDEYHSGLPAEQDVPAQPVPDHPRRSKRIHAQTVDGSYNLGGEHNISSLVGQLISRKRRKLDEGEEDMLPMRRSIRQDPNEEGDYLPCFPLILEPSEHDDAPSSSVAVASGSNCSDDAAIDSLFFDGVGGQRNTPEGHRDIDVRPDILDDSVGVDVDSPSSQLAEPSTTSTPNPMATIFTRNSSSTVPHTDTSRFHGAEDTGLPANQDGRELSVRSIPGVRTLDSHRNDLSSLTEPAASSSRSPALGTSSYAAAGDNQLRQASRGGSVGPERPSQLPSLPGRPTNSLGENDLAAMQPIEDRTRHSLPHPTNPNAQQQTLSTPGSSTSNLPPTPVSAVKKSSNRVQAVPTTPQVKQESEKSQERRKKQIEDFCSSISSEVIAKELSRVVYGVSFIHTVGLESLCHSMASLDGYGVTADPLRMRPESLSNYMATFSLAKHQEVANAAWALVLRQRVIVHEFRLARVVLDMEGKLCDEIFSRGTFLRTPANWIEELLRDIEAKVVIKQRINFSSSSYLGQTGSAAVRYVEPDWAFKERCWHRKRPSNAEFQRMIAKCLGRILRHWLDLPSSFISRGRDQLVSVLVEHFGPGILCLESVWDLHRDLPRFLFKNPPHDYHTNAMNKDRPFDPAAMADFEAAVASVDVHEEIELLSDVCLAFVRLSQAYNAQQAEQITYIPGATVDPTLPCGIYDRRRNIVQLFKDNLVVLDHLRSKNRPDTLSDSQVAILRSPDARICLREKAPSRSLWLRRVDNKFMRTRAGFFSALIFRNVLFNSEAFIHRPSELNKSKFGDLAEWNTYVADLYQAFPNRDARFFCNPFALGQYIENRTIDQAQHFWTVSQACDWPKPEAWPLSFSDMHRLLRRIKSKNGLPGCGSLSVYLLCADMVYYGMVDPPSLADIAGIIRSLDMGALSGLQILGYLKTDQRRKPDLNTIEEAVAAFRQDIVLLLTANGIADERTSLIDLEHILCKFSRLWNLRLYRKALPL